MSSPGRPPLKDVSGRMAVFARTFGEEVGIPDASGIPSADALVAIVRTGIPRGRPAEEEARLLEASAYVGEWLRHRAEGTWIAGDAPEPYLQLADASGAVVYLLPIVQLLRTASSAGYDGIAATLDHVLHDVGERLQRMPLDELRVEPPDEREAVVEWVRENAGVRRGTRAALWRRCGVCSRIDESSLMLERATDDWEGEAATAAAILAAHAFECPCGGPPGSTTRFLMIRRAGSQTQFGDIYVSTTHTRVGCWRIDGNHAAPLDALALASGGPVAG